MTGYGGGSASGSRRQAAHHPKVDHSVLRPSIEVSVTGMKQALMAAENGNKEVILQQT